MVQVATAPAPTSNPPDPPAAESEPTGSLRSSRAASAMDPFSSTVACVRSVRSPGASVAESIEKAVPPSSL